MKWGGREGDTEREGEEGETERDYDCDLKLW